MPNLRTEPTIGTVVFDLETNGLLLNATEIHCAAVYYEDTDDTETYNNENPGKGMSAPVVRAVQHIQMADYIVGHNIVCYDIPIIKSIFPFFNPTGIIVDTLILSRLCHPNLLDIDKKHEWEGMPTKLYGSHSLEAYGYRLGERKGDYGKTTDWSEWSQEMEDYCYQDVQVTKKLCDHFHPYLNGSR